MKVIAAVTLLLMFLPAQRAAESVANEKPIVLEPFFVVGNTAKETGLSLSVRLHKLRRDGHVLVIDEPLVTAVAAGSVAEKAGIARGDRLVRIGDLELEGLESTRWHQEFLKSHDGELVVFAIRKADSKTVRLIRFHFVGRTFSRTETKKE